MRTPDPSQVAWKDGEIVARRCSMCREMRPIEEFTRDTRDSVCGRQRVCRGCARTYQKTRWSQLSPEQRKMKGVRIICTITKEMALLLDERAEERGLFRHEYLRGLIAKDLMLMPRREDATGASAHEHARGVLAMLQTVRALRGASDAPGPAPASADGSTGYEDVEEGA